MIGVGQGANVGVTVKAKSMNLLLNLTESINVSSVVPNIDRCVCMNTVCLVPMYKHLQTSKVIFCKYLLKNRF
jgi:hypothetical protein